MHRYRPVFALFFVLLALAVSKLHADDAAIITAVTAADDAHWTAMVKADATLLSACLSDQLHYAHSVQLVETKKEFIASLTTKRTNYHSVEYKTRDFSVVAPGVVLMKGRALVKVGKRTLFQVDINFLAVWRLENDHWRLYALQSSRNGEPTRLGSIDPETNKIAYP